MNQVQSQLKPIFEEYVLRLSGVISSPSTTIIVIDTSPRQLPQYLPGLRVLKHLVVLTVLPLYKVSSKFVMLHSHG